MDSFDVLQVRVRYCRLRCSTGESAARPVRYWRICCAILKNLRQDHVREAAGWVMIADDGEEEPDMDLRSAPLSPSLPPSPSLS
eukprot:1349793-Rhodomonas_salina.7